MINIIGVVILYQPDTAILFDNINTYLPHINKLLIYDNSETLSPALEKLVHEQHSTKIEFTFFGSNEGISRRLNMAADHAISNGYDHLLMMDQDSSFAAGVLPVYLEKIKINRIGNVAQFGVNCQPEHTPVEKGPVPVISLITSGSILDLRLFQQIGHFDEKLFIDFVDLEFSYRVVEKGFVNLLFTDIILQHQIGYIKMGRSLKNFALTPRLLHSPIRVYYIVRNGLYLLYKVKHITRAAKTDIKRAMKIIKNDLLYNEDLSGVYAGVIMGVIDFLKNKMGKK